MLTTYRFYQKYQVLNMIHHFAPISRKKLIALMDLRPASIGDLTKELLEEGLIVETGLYSSGHGRKRILLDINKRNLCALALSFSGLRVTYTVAQFDGEIVLKQEQNLTDCSGDDLRLKQVTEQISSILQQTSDRHIVGIGLCDPIYNPILLGKATSAESYDGFLSWLHDSLRPCLESHFSLPVSSFGTVSLPALAEHRFGCAVGCDHFLCVELSNGLGISIFANGKAITGAHGMAGEIGHTIIDSGELQKGNPCYCGKTGCVEQTAAFPYLQSVLQKAIDEGVTTALTQRINPKKRLRATDIRAALEKNDRLCMRYVRQAAERAGLAIANAVTVLNPERIVLYGFMLELGDFYLTTLKNTILENVMSPIEIYVSKSTESLLPLGAAAEMFSTFLRVEENQWIYKLPSDGIEDAEGEEPGES